jgi:hypothetical protein
MNTRPSPPLFLDEFTEFRRDAVEGALAAAPDTIAPHAGVKATTHVHTCLLEAPR